MTTVSMLTSQHEEIINNTIYTCVVCGKIYKRTDELFGIGFSYDLKDNITFCCNCIRNTQELESRLKSKEYVAFYSKDSINKKKYIFYGKNFWENLYAEDAVMNKPCGG